MSETMRREIMGQPELLARLLPELRGQAAGIRRPSRRVLAAGCGDGFFAAGAAAGLFAEAGIDYRAVSSHELAFHLLLGTGDLVVLMSISGGTRRTVQAARRARASGVRTLALTCNAGSALAEACDQTFLLPFQPLSRRTPHTADYLVTLLALAVLGEAWRGEVDPGLDQLSETIHAVVASADGPAAEAAKSVDLAAKIFVLGQASNLATAHYIAAKFHESGGLIALAGETENFVHGMNFMVEPADLVCVIGGDGPGDFRAEELLPGLGLLSRHRVVIGPAGVLGRSPAELPAAATRPTLSVFPAAVAGQLLCLAVVERHQLPVEETRAGRNNAASHADVQRKWMTETTDDWVSSAR